MKKMIIVIAMSSVFAICFAGCSVPKKDVIINVSPEPSPVKTEYISPTPSLPVVETALPTPELPPDESSPEVTAAATKKLEKLETKHFQLRIRKWTSAGDLRIRVTDVFEQRPSEDPKMLDSYFVFNMELRNTGKQDCKDGSLNFKLFDADGNSYSPVSENGIATTAEAVIAGNSILGSVAFRVPLGAVPQCFRIEGTFINGYVLTLPLT